MVYRAIVSVVTEPIFPGQLVTVGAHDVMVYVVVPQTVDVVKEVVLDDTVEPSALTMEDEEDPDELVVGLEEAVELDGLDDPVEIAIWLERLLLEVTDPVEIAVWLERLLLEVSAPVEAEDEVVTPA